MGRLTFLLALLLCLPGFVWIEASGGGGGGPNLAVIEEIDFDGSGCADSSSGDTCSTGGDPDYATSPAPLAGTYSLYLADNSYPSSANTTEAADVSTMDFQLRFSAATQNRYLGSIRDGSGTSLARLDQEAGSGLVLKCGPFDVASTISLPSVGANTFYVRLRHDPDGANDDICHVSVSTSAYGATDVGSQTQVSLTGGDLGGSGAQWEFHGEAGGPVIIDEVVLCDGDAGTTEGRCDTP